MTRDCVALRAKLPFSYDVQCVVGIPRSGLLVATTLALLLNCPVTTPNQFGRNEWQDEHGTRPLKATEPRRNQRKVVLLVDDSVFTGQAMNKSRALLQKLCIQQSLILVRACLYTTPNNASNGVVNYFVRSEPPPRIFEWNFMNHAVLCVTATDMDGVLCRDCTPEENDDGERYAAFLRNATPLYLPQTRPVLAIVTCRLEKYREQTVAWLDKHSVKYHHLMMMPYSSAAERRRCNNHAQWKAKCARSVNAAIFYESSARQAAQICSILQKPVLCVDTMSVHNPPPLPAEQ